MLRAKKILKIVALILVGAFSAQELVYATPFDSSRIASAPSKPGEIILQEPTRFEAPLDFVTMREIHKGPPQSVGGQAPPFIIHIQDAHANLSGQQNMADALDWIMSKYGVSLVLSEGGSQDCSLTPIKKIAPPEVWKRLARSYLVQGKISGEEYLNLISDHPMKIMGLEDLTLYLKSVQNYAELADKRQQILDYLKTISAALTKLKRVLYPEELVAYEAKKGNGNGDAAASGNFETSFRELMELAQTRHVDLAEFPNLMKLVELQLQEKLIDFNLANLEQAALVEEISNKGGEEDIKDFLNKVGQMKNAKASQYAYFQNTFQLAREKKILLTKYPNLVKYGEYLKEFSELNLDQVLDELTKAEDKVYLTLLSKDALLIRSIDRYIGLLETAYRIQMSTKEFNMFKVNEPDFATVAYLAFINRELAKRGYFEDLIPYRNLMEEGKRLLEAFYDSVTQRDFAFIRNTERILKEENQKVAVLISGGYHTPHLKKLFREKGYSMAILTPIVTSETNQQKYEKQLLAPIRPEIKKIAVVQDEKKSDKSLSALEKDLVKAKRSDGVRAAQLGLGLYTGQLSILRSEPSALTHEERIAGAKLLGYEIANLLRLVRDVAKYEGADQQQIQMATARLGELQERTQVFIKSMQDRMVGTSMEEKFQGVRDKVEKLIQTEQFETLVELLEQNGVGELATRPELRSHKPLIWARVTYANVQHLLDVRRRVLQVSRGEAEQVIEEWRGFQPTNEALSPSRIIDLSQDPDKGSQKFFPEGHDIAAVMAEGSSKPAALVSIGSMDPLGLVLLEMARERGLSVAAVPPFHEVGGPHYFVSRDPNAITDMLALYRRYRGIPADERLHRALGKLLGYPPEAVADFIRPKGARLSATKASAEGPLVPNPEVLLNPREHLDPKDPAVHWMAHFQEFARIQNIISRESSKPALYRSLGMTEDDVIQELALQVFRDEARIRTGYDRTKPFAPYYLTVLRNKVSDILDPGYAKLNKNRAETPFSQMKGADFEKSIEAPLTTGVPTADDATFRGWLEESIGSISEPRDRKLFFVWLETAFSMGTIYGAVERTKQVIDETEDVPELKGLTGAALRARLHRALEHIRTFIDEKEIEVGLDAGDVLSSLTNRGVVQGLLDKKDKILAKASGARMADNNIPASDHDPRDYPADQNLSLRLGFISSINVSLTPGNDLEVSPAEGTAVKPGQEKGLQAELNEPIEIGRSPQGTKKVAIIGDAAVSGRHVKVTLIKKEKGDVLRFQIQNLSRTNPVMVDISPVPQSTVFDRDQILSELQLLFRGTKPQMAARDITNALLDRYRELENPLKGSIFIQNAPVYEKVKKVLRANGANNWNNKELIGWLIKELEIDAGQAQNKENEETIAKIKASLSKLDVKTPENDIRSLQKEELDARFRRLTRIQGEAKLIIDFDKRPFIQSQAGDLIQKLEESKKEVTSQERAWSLASFTIKEAKLVNAIAVYAVSGDMPAAGLQLQGKDFPQQTSPSAARAYFSAIQKPDFESSILKGLINSYRGSAIDYQAVHSRLVKDSEKTRLLRELAARVQPGDRISVEGEGVRTIVTVEKGWVTYELGAEKKEVRMERRLLEDAIIRDATRPDAERQYKFLERQAPAGARLTVKANPPLAQTAQRIPNDEARSQTTEDSEVPRFAEVYGARLTDKFSTSAEEEIKHPVLRNLFLGILLGRAEKEAGEKLNLLGEQGILTFSIQSLKGREKEDAQVNFFAGIDADSPVVHKEIINQSELAAFREAQSKLELGKVSPENEVKAITFEENRQIRVFNNAANNILSKIGGSTLEGMLEINLDNLNPADASEATETFKQNIQILAIAIAGIKADEHYRNIKLHFYSASQSEKLTAYVQSITELYQYQATESEVKTRLKIRITGLNDLTEGVGYATVANAEPGYLLPIRPIVHYAIYLLSLKNLSQPRPDDVKDFVIQEIKRLSGNFTDRDLLNVNVLGFALGNTSTANIAVAKKFMLRPLVKLVDQAILRYIENLKAVGAAA